MSKQKSNLNYCEAYSVCGEHDWRELGDDKGYCYYQCRVCCVTKREKIAIREVNKYETIFP